MYWQVIQVSVQPGRREELLRLSQTYAEECVREEPGTLGFTFLLDETDQDRFCAIEQYADRPAHEAHTNGETIRRWAPNILPLLAGLPFLLAHGDQFGQ